MSSMSGITCTKRAEMAHALTRSRTWMRAGLASPSAKHARLASTMGRMSIVASTRRIPPNAPTGADGISRGLDVSLSAAKHAVVGYSLVMRSGARLYGVKVKCAMSRLHRYPYARLSHRDRGLRGW